MTLIDDITDPNPVLVWDGATLGGTPIQSGGYTLAVSVRRSAWQEVESGASLIVRFQF